jgi:hypothetical protein
MKKILLLSLFTFIFLACEKDKIDNPNETGQEEVKQITWELVVDLEEIPRRITVSDDGNFLFYTSSGNYDIYRINLNTNEKVKIEDGPESKMYFSYVHYFDGTLYTITYKNNKSYFGISSDNGETLTEHLVDTFEFMSEDPIEGFLKVDHNKMLNLGDGKLIVPTPSNNSFALSLNGGLNWQTKPTEVNHTFFIANKGNEIYALYPGWEGDYDIGSPSELKKSTNMGDSWTIGTLKYLPQAIDKNGNFISCGSSEIRKYENGEWTIFKWDNNPEVSGQEARNLSSGGQIEQRLVDIEFDEENNLYLLVLDKVYKTTLN